MRAVGAAQWTKGVAFWFLYGTSKQIVLAFTNPKEANQESVLDPVQSFKFLDSQLFIE